MNVTLRSLATLSLAWLLTVPGFSAERPKPLKVLLVTGGCCHDYPHQKDILKNGLEQRANVVVTQLHTDDKTTRPPLAHANDAKYADGYDLVIHDECAADLDQADQVRNVLAPHRAGLPAVALHCAMHSFRVVKDFARPQTPGSDGALWFDFLGLQSSRHGPQAPIEVHFTGSSPITTGFKDWTTGPEELYNNVQPPAVFSGHKSLATGHQKATDKKGKTYEDTSVVIWTNEYGPKKARVFATTLGHNNVLVESAQYLDLVTRGVLWAAGKLGPDGKPLPGYGPTGKR